MSHENITDAEYQDFAFLWAHMGCDSLYVPPAEEMAAIPDAVLAEEYLEALTRMDGWKLRRDALQVESIRRQNIISIASQKMHIRNEPGEVEHLH